MDVQILVRIPFNFDFPDISTDVPSSSWGLFNLSTNNTFSTSILLFEHYAHPSLVFSIIFHSPTFFALSLISFFRTKLDKSPSKPYKAKLGLIFSSQTKTPSVRVVLFLQTSKKPEHLESTASCSPRRTLPSYSSKTAPLQRDTYRPSLPLAPAPLLPCLLPNVRPF